MNAISFIESSKEFVENLSQDYMNDPEFTDKLQNTPQNYHRENGLLYFKNRLRIPKGNHRLNLLHDMHSVPVGGHLGRKKTLERIKSKYYWKNMETTVKEYVASCDIFQISKSVNHKPFGLLKLLEPPKGK